MSNSKFKQPNKTLKPCKYCGKLTYNKVFCDRSCSGRYSGLVRMRQWRLDNPERTEELNKQHGQILAQVAKGTYKPKEPEFHPCKFCGIPTPNEVFCTQSCAAKYNNLHGLKTFMEQHPNQPVDNLRVFCELNPTFRSDNARIQGLKYGPITGSTNISKFNEEHPEILSQRGTEHGPLNLATWRESDPADFLQHQSDAGRLGGLETVKSGRIWDLILESRRHKEIPHLGHIHLSPDEMSYCVQHVLTKYDISFVDANVSLSGIFIDWVIANPIFYDKRDPFTWLRVIEHHCVRSWEGETADSYTEKRYKKLRSLGVACPIEVVCFYE